MEVADKRAPGLVRRRVRMWLEALGWPEDECDDLVMAASEAVSNVVEHAYPPSEAGMAEVDVRQVNGPGRTRRVVIAVRDNGRWRDPPPEPVNRRRGLPIMRAMTDALRLHATPSGTCVELISRPVPRPQT